MKNSGLSDHQLEKLRKESGEHILSTATIVATLKELDRPRILDAEMQGKALARANAINIFNVGVAFGKAQTEDEGPRSDSPIEVASTRASTKDPSDVTGKNSTDEEVLELVIDANMASDGDIYMCGCREMNDVPDPQPGWTWGGCSDSVDNGEF